MRGEQEENLRAFWGDQPSFTFLSVFGEGPEEQKPPGVSPLVVLRLRRPVCGCLSSVPHLATAPPLWAATLSRERATEREERRRRWTINAKKTKQNKTPQVEEDKNPAGFPPSGKRKRRSLSPPAAADDRNSHSIPPVACFIFVWVLFFCLSSFQIRDLVGKKATNQQLSDSTGAQHRLTPHSGNLATKNDFHQLFSFSPSFFFDVPLHPVVVVVVAFVHFLFSSYTTSSSGRSTFTLLFAIVSRRRRGVTSWLHWNDGSNYECQQQHASRKTIRNYKDFFFFFSNLCSFASSHLLKGNQHCHYYSVCVCNCVHFQTGGVKNQSSISQEHLVLFEVASFVVRTQFFSIMRK